MAWGNPFSRDRDAHYANLQTYRILTTLSFLLNIVPTFYYTFAVPTDGSYKRSTLFGESDMHPTPFTLNRIFVSIYWDGLWLFQVGYLWHLFSRTEDLKKAASAVGSHFITFNLLQFAFVMLFTRAHFVWAEVALVANFIQQAMLYFRHPTTPRFIHIPVVSLPLTWLFFAVLWNGAIMVHCHDLLCRIVANISVWGIAVYALFFLVVYKDYSIGFATSFLAAGLGVSQFLTKVIALQWIFAFTVMGIVFVATLVVCVPSIFGTADVRSDLERNDRERAPLLADS